MQKVNDPAVRHTSSGALIRRFLPYLAKYKKTLFIDLWMLLIWLVRFRRTRWTKHFVSPCLLIWTGSRTCSGES